MHSQKIEIYVIIYFNFEEAVCSCIHVLACLLTLRINLFLPIGLAPNFVGHSLKSTARVPRYEVIDIF
jgi:hypothetical protein